MSTSWRSAPVHSVPPTVTVMVAEAPTVALAGPEIAEIEHAANAAERIIKSPKMKVFSFMSIPQLRLTLIGCPLVSSTEPL